MIKMIDLVQCDNDLGLLLNVNYISQIVEGESDDTSKVFMTNGSFYNVMGSPKDIVGEILDEEGE